MRARLLLAGSVALVSLWSAPALTGPHAAAPALPAAGALVEGDLIFRSGVSRESALIRLADPGARYSHVGLVDVSDDTPYVVHIEPASDTGDARIRREPLAVFLAADRASGYVIRHLAAGDRGRGAAAVDAALRYRARGVAFDERADLATAGEQYCTELVWRAYRDAGVDLLDGDPGPDVPFLGRPVVRLTALLGSRHLEPAASR
jgi:hypothetical protein